jgi:predicted MPP superfamily phosphohydrolase
MTNILKSLINIKKYGDNDLSKITAIENPIQPRVNKEGTPFDAFIKDSFCNTFGISDPKIKMAIFLKEFSHLGSQNFPPDIIIRGGDAVEIKKVEKSGGTTIALNSSYPKSKLKANGPMITKEVKNCETWSEKDMVYCVGNVFDHKVRIISFVYGDCYAAKAEIYEKIREAMVNGISKLNLKLSQTGELARLNEIDPLKITDLRVRGMFQIRAPLKHFSDFIKPDLSKNLNVFCIMRKEKFQSFSESEKKEALKNMAVTDIQVPDPNNPSKHLDAKLISFTF